ncbi:MAG: DUF4157 domain-containing protein [Sandaracinaceae bacterium]|nr:DUF4157 domain-containing protein [Sandaracinaceae bacterium]
MSAGLGNHGATLFFARKRSGSDAEPQRSPPAEGALPHQQQMEQAFHENLAGVRAHAGIAPGSDGPPFAATKGEHVVFAERSPSPELVAHEVTHVLQAREHGTSTARRFSRPDDPAEREAHTIARQVSRGAAIPSPREAPSAAISLYAGENESLTEGAMAALSEWEIDEATYGARMALQRGDDTGARMNLTALQRELVRRGLEERPPPPGVSTLEVMSVLLSDDPVHVRFVLERVMATRGTGEARNLVAAVEDAARELESQIAALDLETERARRFQRDYEAGDVPAGVPWSAEEYAAEWARRSELATERDRVRLIAGVAWSEMDGLLDEREEFLRDLERVGYELTRGILNESETRVRAELERYGISWEDETDVDCPPDPYAGCFVSEWTSYQFSQDARSARRGACATTYWTGTRARRRAAPATRSTVCPTSTPASPSRAAPGRMCVYRTTSSSMRTPSSRSTTRSSRRSASVTRPARRSRRSSPSSPLTHRETRSTSRGWSDWQPRRTPRRSARTRARSSPTSPACAASWATI